MKVTPEQEAYLEKRADSTAALGGRVKPRDPLAFEAFAQLNNNRAPGFDGPGPILLSEVLAWCELRGISDPDHREMIRRAVYALDAEWRQHGKAKS